MLNNKKFRTANAVITSVCLPVTLICAFKGSGAIKATKTCASKIKLFLVQFSIGGKLDLSIKGLK